MKLNQRRLAALGIIGALAALTTFLIGPRIVFNDTASEPIGIYWRTNEEPSPGDFVEVRAADLPYFYSWAPPYLLKRIAAVAPAQAKVDDSGVFINGQYLGPRPRSSLVKPFYWDGPLPPKSVWLYGKPDKSFDSRHFGPVRLAVLSKRIVPVWTF